MNTRTFLITLFLFLILLNQTNAQINDNSRIPDGLDQNTNAKIAIVYSTGGTADRAFNDAALRGIKAAMQNNPGITIDQACTSACTIDEINLAIIAYAVDGSYDLIIGIGFAGADAISASAVVHPNQNFMIIDSVVTDDSGNPLPNVNSIVFKEQEGSFLAGAMAAMVTQTNKIGFLGGLDIELVNKYLAGYVDGAKFINPNITVGYGYSPNPSNPWGDLTVGEEIAHSFVNDGYDIVFHYAGGTGIGVINGIAAANADAETKYYAIGVDFDQDYVSPGDVLTSMVKRVDVAVEQDIQKVIDGTWKAQITSLGLKEGGVGISNMTYTQSVANGTWKNGKTRIEVITDITNEIINGSIVVKSQKSEITGVAFNFGPEYYPKPEKYQFSSSLAKDNEFYWKVSSNFTAVDFAFPFQNGDEITLKVLTNSPIFENITDDTLPDLSSLFELSYDGRSALAEDINIFVMPKSVILTNGEKKNMTWFIEDLDLLDTELPNLSENVYSEGTNVVLRREEMGLTLKLAWDIDTGILQHFSLSTNSLDENYILTVSAFVKEDNNTNANFNLPFSTTSSLVFSLFVIGLLRRKLEVFNKKFTD